MRQRRETSPWPLAALALAIAAVTGFVLRYALRTTAFVNDEYGTVIAGRLVAREPFESLTATTQPFFSRGPERLTAYVLALPDMLLGSTPDEMRAGHVLLALAYALVAVPAYGLLRGLDVPRAPAAAVAVAAIVGPWMVFGTTMLNVTLAAPLTVAFTWAAWRAIVEPSLRREVVAVAVAVLMTTARTSHGAFFGAAVLAAVAAAWWARPPEARPWRLPLLFARRTPVIAALAAAGVLAVLLVGTDGLAGEDYAGAAQLDLPLDQIWRSLTWTTAVLTIATGFVAVPIGGAWLLRQAVRGTDLRTGVFAVLALGIFAIYVYLTGAAGAQEQERYPAFLAALPVVALGAALFRREAWVPGTLLVGALAARAVATRAIDEVAEPLSYFFAPAQLFFSRAVVQRLTTVLPEDAVVTVVLVVVVLVAAAVALLVRRVPAVAWVAVAGVLAIGAVAGVYTLRKYEPATRPADFEALAWIERAGGGDRAVIWNYGWGANEFDRGFRTRLSLYFNGTACCGEWPKESAAFLRPGGRLELPDDPPEVLAGHIGYRPVVFAARDLPRAEPYGPPPLRVQRFLGTPRAVAVVEDAGDDGAVDDGARIALVGSLEGRCLDVQLYGLPEATEPAGFSLAGARGSLDPDEDRWVRIRGDATLRRTGSGDAPVMMGEIRYVGCEDALSG